MRQSYYVYQSFYPCPECKGDRFSKREVYLSTEQGLVHESTNPFSGGGTFWLYLGLCPAGVAITGMYSVLPNLTAALLIAGAIYGIPFLIIYGLNTWWESRHPMVFEIVCQACRHTMTVQPDSLYLHEKFDLARHREEERRRYDD